MEIFSALRALCDGNPPVTGGFPSQRPVTRSFGVFFDLRLNKLLRRQSRRRWFETPSPSLWRHCNVAHASLAPINCTGTQSHALSKSLDLEVACWALFQYPIRHLMTRSHKVSKQWDFYLELSSRSEIWQTPRQHCCRCVCQISKRYEHFNPRPSAFETLRDLTIRRLIWYWNGPREDFISWHQIFSWVAMTGGDDRAPVQLFQQLPPGCTWHVPFYR